MGTIVKTVAIIPARYASERFPGKVLAPLAGKALVAHVADRAAEASTITEVIVATDDQRVVDALDPFDIQTVMTNADHPSGTDRIAEVASGLEADIIVNVQGDEPLIDPATIDACVQPLLDDPVLEMSTASHRITDDAEIDDPNIVKVVCDNAGRALYFSRARIPHAREASDAPVYRQHIGIYAYRRAFLLDVANMKPTPCEQAERLEQLRVLENGHSIAVVDTEYASIGVDTPGDLERVRALLEVRVQRT